MADLTVKKSARAVWHANKRGQVENLPRPNAVLFDRADYLNRPRTVLMTRSSLGRYMFSSDRLYGTGV